LKTWLISHQKSFLIIILYFGQEGAKNLAEDLEVPGEVPIVQSIREAGDYGRPAAMQTGSIVASVFENITRKVVEETVRRNDSLPATEAIKLPQWQDVLPLKNNKE
jgi:hypothetical protein